MRISAAELDNLIKEELHTVFEELLDEAGPLATARAKRAQERGRPAMPVVGADRTPRPQAPQDPAPSTQDIDPEQAKYASLRRSYEPSVAPPAAPAPTAAEPEPAAPEAEVEVPPPSPELEALPDAELTPFQREVADLGKARSVRQFMAHFSKVLTKGLEGDGAAQSAALKNIHQALPMLQGLSQEDKLFVKNELNIANSQVVETLNLVYGFDNPELAKGIKTHFARLIDAAEQAAKGSAEDVEYLKYSRERARGERRPASDRAPERPSGTAEAATPFDSLDIEDVNTVLNQIGWRSGAIADAATKALKRLEAVPGDHTEDSQKIKIVAQKLANLLDSGLGKVAIAENINAALKNRYISILLQELNNAVSDRKEIDRWKILVGTK